ncbi:MAG: hypothetical protein IJP64_05080 [Oscillospiraceae bacterium]|nr:hypothetical protein [Oscillospiraceae bacterium]
MYKVYRGSGGPPRRVEDDHERRAHPQRSPLPAPGRPGPESFAEPIRQAVESLLGRITGELETEDLILLLILYLLYRESGDIEMLFILGAMLLL